MQDTDLMCGLRGKSLDKNDDANYLYELAMGNVEYPHQHLHTIIDPHGNVLCDGTPSLARYINPHPAMSVKIDATWSEHLANTVPLAFMMMA